MAERIKGAALLVRTTAAVGEIDNIPARWEAFRQLAEIASIGHPPDITTIIKARSPRHGRASHSINIVYRVTKCAT